MSDIVVRRIFSTDVPEDLAQAVQPILLKWEAAVARVASASNNSGQRWPVGSPEEILQQRFTQLPQERQDFSRRRAQEAFQRPRFLRRATAALGGADVTDLSVDLAKIKPIGIPSHVDQQRMATETLAFLKQFSLDTGASPPAQAQNPPSSITLRMQRMVCVDETNAVWPISENGEDEISIGGATVDSDQVAGEITAFNCGNYDDSTRVDFNPPQDLVTVDLRGATYPRAVIATLILVERDHGGIEGLVNKIVEKLAEEAKDQLAGWLAGLAVGAAFGGIVGAIIGLVVGYLIDKLVSTIASWWDDDPFTPGTILVSLPSGDSDFNGSRTMPSTVVRFRGPGEYAMRYDWQLR